MINKSKPSDLDYDIRMIACDLVDANNRLPHVYITSQKHHTSLSCLILTKEPYEKFMTIPEYTGENKAPRNSMLMECHQGLVQLPTELDENSDLSLTRCVNL